jgi:Peptidase family M23
LFLCAGAWFLTREVTIVFVLAAAIFAFWFIALPWGFWNFNLRYIFLAAFLGAAYHGGRWLFMTVAIEAIFAAEIWRRLRPRKRDWIDVKFPLAGRNYYIAHGGTWVVLNHHARVASQKFALDILKLDRFGWMNGAVRAGASYRELIYDDVVLSPCDGTVTAAIDGLPELPVGEQDRKNIAGNHVVIRAGDKDVYVGLAHLKNGSVCVRSGDEVRAGQIIGRVGNSGNTTLPHLHIHAKRGGDPSSMLDGEGVPMRFFGRWLARNSLVRT